MQQFNDRRILLLSQLFIVFSCVSTVSAYLMNSLPLVFLSRLLIGFHLGITYTLMTNFTNDITDPNLKAINICLERIIFNLGIIYSSLTGLSDRVNKENRWPLIIVLQIIPCFLSICVLRILPDSPVFLLKKDRHDECINSLKFYFKKSCVESQLCLIERQEAQTHSCRIIDENWPKMFLRLRPIIICCVLLLIQQISLVDGVSC